MPIKEFRTGIYYSKPMFYALLCITNSSIFGNKFSCSKYNALTFETFIKEDTLELAEDDDFWDNAQCHLLVDPCGEFYVKGNVVNIANDGTASMTNDKFIDVINEFDKWVAERRRNPEQIGNKFYDTFDNYWQCKWVERAEILAKRNFHKICQTIINFYKFGKTDNIFGKPLVDPFSQAAYLQRVEDMKNYIDSFNYCQKPSSIHNSGCVRKVRRLMMNAFKVFEDNNARF